MHRKLASLAFCFALAALSPNRQSQAASTCTNGQIRWLGTNECCDLGRVFDVYQCSGGVWVPTGASVCRSVVCPG